MGVFALVPFAAICCVLSTSCASAAVEVTEAAPKSSLSSSTPSVETVAATRSTIESTTSTSTIAPPPTIDVPFLLEQLTESSKPDQPGAVSITVFDGDGLVVHAALGTDPSGEIPALGDAIRIGSITKTITSIAVLSLVDDGLINLDLPVSDYVSRLKIDNRVTIRDALQHSSGLPEHIGELQTQYLNSLADDATRAWSPEEIIALAGVDDLDFDPGTAFEYSNTNYMVLGVLLEEVTGRAYHDVVRERIIEPLEMSSTYLANFETGPEVFGGYYSFSGSVEPIEFDFTSFATNSWASGGMVSTGRDLHVMFSALFAGSIISPDLVDEMTADPVWGFGIWAPEWNSDTPLRGHDGRIPGAGTFLVHAPETGLSVFTMSNADYLFVSPATAAVARAIGVPGVKLIEG